jgi:Amt family ammonium transporter
MKFSAWIVFAVLWITFVYAPVCNWVWGGGWMHRMGALDFAGGNVVHINAGVSGLVLALVLGKRNGYGKEPMIPSSVAFTALGAALAGLTWLCLEWKISGKPTLLDMASGVIAGLVAITPVAP